MSGRPADLLGAPHRLPVPLTHNPQQLPRALDRVAPVLRPLASAHGGLPLLQGHQHVAGTPAQGARRLPAHVITHHYK